MIGTQGTVASGASTVSPIFHTLDTFKGTLVFDEALIGVNFIAVHFGSAGGGGGAFNQTLFFQFNFAEATTQVDLNRLGYSNAIGAFSTPPEVPEPATWAMMLMGFGAAGYSMRRRRKVSIAQVA